MPGNVIQLAIILVGNQKVMVKPRCQIQLTFAHFVISFISLCPTTIVILWQIFPFFFFSFLYIFSKHKMYINLNQYVYLC